MSRHASSRWPLAALLALAACKTPASVALPDAAPAPAIANSPSASAEPLSDIAPPLTDGGPEALLKDGVTRKGELLLTLGDQPRGEMVEDTFYVLTTDPQAPLDAAVAQARAMVAALWHHHHMAQRLDHVVLIWVFASTQALVPVALKFVPGVNTDVRGMYDEQSRMIFFTTQPDGVTTLDRQQCRPMIAADFPGSVSHRWVREGFCALFDAADVSASGEMHFHPDAHIKTLLDALADAGTAGSVKVQSLLKLSNTAFWKDALLDEALAREMMRFLSTRNQLWDWYHAWRDGVATDPTGEKALLAVTGKTPEQMNGEFVAWVTSPAAVAR